MNDFDTNFYSPCQHLRQHQRRTRASVSIASAQGRPIFNKHIYLATTSGGATRPNPGSPYRSYRHPRCKVSKSGGGRHAAKPRSHHCIGQSPALQRRNVVRVLAGYFLILHFHTTSPFLCRRPYRYLLLNTVCQSVSSLEYIADDPEHLGRSRFPSKQVGVVLMQHGVLLAVNRSISKQTSVIAATLRLHTHHEALANLFSS